MSTLREERIRRRILMRKREFASGLKKCDGRDYKATSPVGRPLRNNPESGGVGYGKEYGLMKWRQSHAYKKNQRLK
jgi:hypothetical protein